VLFSGESDDMLRSAEGLAQSHGLQVIGAVQKPPRFEAFRDLLLNYELRSQPREVVAQPGRSPGELLAAIAAGEIFCLYQPKVEMRSGACAGVEAQVRWRHPQDGVLGPEAFMQLAESSGLVSQLTQEAFEIALAQQARWHAAGTPLTLALNVSAQDLADPGFPDFVAACAHRHGIDPQALTVEVADSGVAQRDTVSREVVTRLRLRRCKLAVDDFGRGNSPMASLRDLVFDEMKVDRSLTHGAGADARHAAIFSACVDIARRLQMQTVAVGVEDRADWDACRKHGVDVAQGEFIAPALSAEEFAAWLRGWDERVWVDELIAKGGRGAPARA
jgi:EAL domain-containing protein (putative c-di-GMP-specific phosphodiesterase class I)